MRNRRKRLVSVGLIFVSLGLLATQFTNCGGSSDDYALFQARGSGCSNVEECIAMDESNLLVESLNSTIDIFPQQAGVNLSGYCNDGDYPYHRMIFSFQTESFSQEIIDSLACVRGRFQKLLELDSFSEDMTGLGSSPSLREEATVLVSIEGAYLPEGDESGPLVISQRSLSAAFYLTPYE